MYRYHTLLYTHIFPACLHLDACAREHVIGSWTMSCHTCPVFSLPHRQEIVNGNIYFQYGTFSPEVKKKIPY